MPIALIRQTNAKSTTRNGVSVSLDTTGADCLVVFVQYYGPSWTAPTITDSLGNTWTALTRRTATNAGIRGFYCLAPSVGASQTFTFTRTDSYPSISVLAFSGVTSYQGENGATGSAATSLATGSITPDENGCLLVAADTYDGTSTETATFANLQTQPYTAGFALGAASAFLLQGAAASASCTFSGSSVGRAAAILCFRGDGTVAFTAGTASTSSVGNTVASLSATAESGGVAPVTYQWQRSTTSGSGFSNVSGATSLTLNDTGLTNGTTYYYRLVYTDAASSTVTSNETSATPAALNDIAVTDSSMFLSPYNWRLSGSTYAETNNPGAYLKTKFSGASCTLLIDTTNQSGLSAGNYPAVAYSVNGGVWTRAQITSGQTTLSLASGLGSGPHTLEMVVVGAWWQSDRWNTPVSALRITGLRLGTGGALSAPTLQSGRAILFADSNGEGYEALAVGVTVANQDAGQAFPLLLSRALGCEIGVIGFAGQGYITAGGGNVPALSTAWDDYSSGNSRLSGGLLSPVPDYLISTHGQNDGSSPQTTVASLITSWLAACGSATKIAICSPSNLNQSAGISAAVTAAANSRVKWVTTSENYLAAGTSGAQQWSNSNHMSVRGHAKYAAALAGGIKSAFESTGGGTNTDLWFKLSEFVEINRP